MQGWSYGWPANKGNAKAPPLGYKYCATPVWVSGTTFTVANYAVADATGQVLIQRNTPTTVNFATSIQTAEGGPHPAEHLTYTGGGGRDVWWYLYALGTKSGESRLMLHRANAATGGNVLDLLPSWGMGAFEYVRQLPIAVYYAASGDMRPFYVETGWPFNPRFVYSLPTSNLGGAGTANVLSGGQAASFTDVALSLWVPPIARLASLRVAVAGGGATTEARLRRKGETHEGFTFIAVPGPSTACDLPTDSAQVIQYKRASGTSDVVIDVLGFVVDQVA